MDQERTIKLLSIVVPTYNEGRTVFQFYCRVKVVLEEHLIPFEFVFINDGSTDDTLEQLYQLRKIDNRVKIIDLSRNFGKEIALTAGLDFCSGDVIIPMDADLQDPPEIIPSMIEIWKQGHDVVYAVRNHRTGDSLPKRITAFLFYRVMNILSPNPIPKDTGDFRLMTRNVVNSITDLREQHRFMKGIFSWVGYDQIGLTYDREPRSKGKSKFNFIKLTSLAWEGITSFSFTPLRIATYIGFFISFFSLLFILYLVFETLFQGNPVPGYPSLMVGIIFFGGLQFLLLGIIGEYIGRIYHEVKRRPLYFVREKIGFNDIERK